jgi:hypothetical protein
MAAGRSAESIHLDRTRNFSVRRFAGGWGDEFRIRSAETSTFHRIDLHPADSEVGPSMIDLRTNRLCVP